MFQKRFARSLALTLSGLLVVTAAAFAADLKTDLDLSTNSPQRDVALGNVAGGASGQIDTGVYYSGGAGTVTFAVDSKPSFVTAASGDTITGAGIENAKHSLIDWVAPCTAGAFSGTVTYKVTAETVQGSVTVTDAYINISGNVTLACVTNHAPVVDADGASVTVDERSAAGMTGTWSDADAGDSVTLSASIGDLVQSGINASGTWSWSYTPDDGPSDSQTVTITADDGTGTSNATNSATFELDVDNVAPTASLSGPSIAIVGQEVSYTASADDVSDADDAAGFTFSFDGGTTWTGAAAATATYKTTFTTCGEKTVSVLAQDKDNGISDPASVTTNAYNATFLAPLKVGEVNLVQKGRVIPVQITVSCDGSISGLSPTIQLLNGDYVSGVDVINSDDNLVTVSVSHADTSGIMREVDSKYLYNLQIPSNLTANQVLTIRVRPWGTSGPSLNILLQIRK